MDNTPRPRFTTTIDDHQRDRGGRPVEKPMPRPYRLVLIEHDQELAATLMSFLTDEGYRVMHEGDGVLGLNLVRRISPDLVILDADLPGIDGITLCGTIRKQANMPIVLLTGGADELQQVVGLDRGADLCMVKPVSLAELRARLRALLRRAAQRHSARVQPLTVGELRLDIHRRRAWVGAEKLDLTPKEFELLAYMMRNHGVVLSREQLLRDVWGGRVAPTSQTLDVHIRWLRQKVEPDPDNPIYIQTVRMIGYRLQEPAADRQRISG
jgi:DNA-binding response OmpR family regulator